MAGLTENMNHGRGGAHTPNGRGLHPRHRRQGASRPRRSRRHTFPLLPAPAPCRQTQLTLPSRPLQSAMSPPHLPSPGTLEPGAWRNPSANPYSPSSAKPPAHHIMDTGLPFLLLPNHPAPPVCGCSTLHGRWGPSGPRHPLAQHLSPGAPPSLSQEPCAPPCTVAPVGPGPSLLPCWAPHSALTTMSPEARAPGDPLLPLSRNPRFPHWTRVQGHPPAQTLRAWVM